MKLLFLVVLIHGMQAMDTNQDNLNTSTKVQQQILADVHALQYIYKKIENEAPTNPLTTDEEYTSGRALHYLLKKQKKIRAKL